MDISGYNKFAILLWKNFTLKKRQLILLVLEIVLMLLFASILMVTRYLVIIKKDGPIRYSAQSIDDVPSFLRIPISFPGDWELAYVPSKSVVVKTIIEHVRNDLNIKMKVQGFSSEKDFEDYVKFKNVSQKMLVAIVFDHNFKDSRDPLPLKVKYYLRFSNFQRSKMLMGNFQVRSWRTAFLFPPVPSIGPRNQDDKDGGSPGYISEGFLIMQHSLDKAIMLYHNSTAAEMLFDNIRIFVQRFPYPTYYRDFFFVYSGIFIHLVILFMFSMNHFTLIQSIVWEKENRLKEYQLMIGLSNWMLWAAYFVTFVSLYLIVIFLICISFFAKIEPVSVLQNSEPSLIFVFLLCFAIISIFFSFMISTFFNKAHYAISVGGFLYFATYFPYSIVSENYEEMTLTQKLASCLCSNIAMALGVQFIVNAETQGTGLKWSNIFTSTLTDNFVFAYVLGMLLFDALLYGLVAWYTEAVFPGEYGMPKPWNFFLMRSYWFGEPTEKKQERSQFYEAIENKYFEAEPTGLVAGIQIKNLYKVFRVRNTTKIAVKDLSLNLYEGQITVLLGHNGAGKSTTLSILSGLYPPTSGEVYINGYNTTTDMTKIRKSLGLCPQQNLLFNYLTVSEHLHFYCVLKGIPPKMQSLEIDCMLTTFNLQEKRDEFSQSLSGGMKRKLSIIIALIGGSKVVILDEPTSGMDPVSRRSTWDLLQQYKQDRTILLTTHYMDEADVLGDRIAIMDQGTLQCCGSSVFLKQIYGVGYHIIMVKESQCNVEEISQLIYYHIPTASLENNVGNELSFILPKDCTYRFEALFSDLEKRQKELGIASFGASITTMEEVFLRVNKRADLQRAVYPPSLMSKDVSNSQNMSTSRNFETADSCTLNECSSVLFNTGCSLYHQQFCAMFTKRVMFNWRHWKLLLLQIFGFLGVLTLLLKADDFSHGHDEPAREMNLHQYGQTIVPLSVSGDSDLTQIFLKQLESMLMSEKQILQKVQGDLLDYLTKNKDCIRSCIVALSIDMSKDETIFTVLFNNEAYHSPSVSLAMLDNIFFLLLSGPNASLTVFNKPQPHIGDNTLNDDITNGLQMALNLHFGMAILISGFCLLTVTERITKAKHIQFVNGIYVLIYWLSALLWDFIIYFISCCLVLVMFKYCQADIYVMDYHSLDTMLIFTLYGWCAIPLMYLLSFLFPKSTSAYIKLILFNYFSGIFSLLIDTTVQFNDGHRLSNASRSFILNLLLLLPNYNLAKCISEYTTIYQNKIMCLNLKPPPAYLNCSKENIKKNVFTLEKNMIGRYLMVMGITGFIFLLLIFLREISLWRLHTLFNQYVYFAIYKKFRKDIVSKELSGESEDQDVEKERKRILEQPHEFLNVPVLVKELKKIYFKRPAILAVKNISFAVQKEECFGLLGFNGAGKTSTFQMLTGEKTVTSGDVFIDGFSIIKNIRKERSRIGYCPQTDALLEYLTGREIMIMYARIWGISEPQIHLYVNNWLHSLHLEPHADKFIYTYSGGNKRRLSTAIALMGKPSVIILDEPSTGMDPVARHLLWNIVTWTRETGKAIILTSHSMEECEALCTRLAIMVKGKFLCLGSAQHLKNKFGHYYILKAKVKTDNDEDHLEDFKNFIATTFPGSVINQENQKIVNYYIPSQDNSWGKVFGILEKAKEQFHLEDYSITQITLEQVFLMFANPDKTGVELEKNVP
ncbi:ATP-binding cassette sub-family A member 3-like [Choloepus didactylus]|uniref:ATP-binding cassette sub-family A member 3-like n=1 Tax=Choloepus didactylus TaxID=27675 RepID=UPI00189D76BA|nr:ATP-binding cassette sub-family A member 3-like [Choloepus didactylus]